MDPWNTPARAYLNIEYPEEPFIWNVLCQIMMTLEFRDCRVSKNDSRRLITHHNT